MKINFIAELGVISLEQWRLVGGGSDQMGYKIIQGRAGNLPIVVR